jgi:hypothetical protein
MDVADDIQSSIVSVGNELLFISSMVPKRWNGLVDVISPDGVGVGALTSEGGSFLEIVIDWSVESGAVDSSGGVSEHPIANRKINISESLIFNFNCFLPINPYASS